MKYKLKLNIINSILFKNIIDLKFKRFNKLIKS